MYGKSSLNNNLRAILLFNKLGLAVLFGLVVICTFAWCIKLFYFINNQQTRVMKKLLPIALVLLLSCKKEKHEPPKDCKTCYADIETAQSPYTFIPIYTKDTFETCQADTIREVTIIYFVDPNNHETYRRITETVCH